MILSKRERYTAILTIGALGIFLFDWFVLSPLLNRRALVQTQRQLFLDKELTPATKLLKNRPSNAARWKEMVAAGLKVDVSTAESQVLHAVQVLAQESGLALSALKPERSEQDKQFQKLVIRATGTGSMANMSRFLSRIQRSTQPLRIADLQIGSRKEGTDDLSIQIGISTILLNPEADKTGKNAATPSREVRP